MLVETAALSGAILLILVPRRPWPGHATDPGLPHVHIDLFHRHRCGAGFSHAIGDRQGLLAA